ncbi:lipid-A-disaccharide synthase [Glaciecola sp. 2405UD65-10]|uniref:lipid-A-disaccharide synthase n=1 Tax=Glaciecola sp. 2405UD65-10 TaxID=3397244 RepID=UPI003B5CCE0A
MPQLSSKPLRVGLVVGETSGANIALGMLKQIKALHPNCIIEGIGSQPLIEQGMHSLFEMDELSVMGLVEVLQHLPRLLHIRKTVVQHFLDNPPDVFIGVDAPDFNLHVEQKLKDAGIPTVHYVSPTVWAWREKRIHKIGKATNLVLGVFPFEQAIYDQYNLPFQFVGHTMADSIPVEIDQMQARERLSIEAKSELLALLPGSRKREIESLLSIFLDTYRKVKVHSPHLKVIIPAVNDAREAQIREILKQENMLESCTITRAAARDVMIAADCALLASGTAALEAMLCKCPMVVAYKMSTLTYMMMKRLYKPAYFSLPNILANELLVPEFLQDEVNADNLSEQLLKVWRTNNKNVLSQFIQIHKTLAAGADKQSAKAVLSLINRYPA